jgi:hypothetical protein
MYTTSADCAVVLPNSRLNTFLMVRDADRCAMDSLPAACPDRRRGR